MVVVVFWQHTISNHLSDTADLDRFRSLGFRYLFLFVVVKLLLSELGLLMELVPLLLLEVWKSR